MRAELNPAQRLHSLGQSLWLDSINRVMLRTGALVAFGTGVGRFPVAQAAAIEVTAVRAHLAAGSGLERVVFAVRGEEAVAAFRAAVGSEPSRIIAPFSITSASATWHAIASSA